LEDYRERAVIGARAAIVALEKLGVSAVVTGSLARGKFKAYSDVDILVTSCPRRLKYAIEGIVEDSLAGVPFDVIYLDELPAWKVGKFTEGALDASELR
jgi:predicted nucleotidyltransferase